ncbi:MAG: hypothetical protein GX038_01510 [Erysipelothrix sp.]|nr:hypothetical protein [Erysipelothrix sp.]
MFTFKYPGGQLITEPEEPGNFFGVVKLSDEVVAVVWDYMKSAGHW